LIGAAFGVPIAFGVLLNSWLRGLGCFALASFGYKRADNFFETQFGQVVDNISTGRWGCLFWRSSPSFCTSDNGQAFSLVQRCRLARPSSLRQSKLSVIFVAWQRPRLRLIYEAVNGDDPIHDGVQDWTNSCCLRSASEFQSAQLERVSARHCSCKPLRGRR
jgi:hypothetical protein